MASLLAWTRNSTDGWTYSTDGRYAISPRESGYYNVFHEGAKLNGKRLTLAQCQQLAEQHAQEQPDEDEDNGPRPSALILSDDVPETCPCGSGKVPFDISDREAGDEPVWCCTACLDNPVTTEPYNPERDVLLACGRLHVAKHLKGGRL